jgi:hypothetical protein
MDDTSRDLFLSPESLECHLPQMDNIPNFFCGANKLVPEFSSDFFWLVVHLLPFFPLSYNLSVIIDIYS